MDASKIAQQVEKDSYGLNAPQETDLYRRASAYLKDVCEKRDLLAGNSDIFVVVQPDLDFVTEMNGHKFEVNGGCQRFTDNSGNVAHVMYLSEKRYTEMGWASYALTIRHELAHVEADLRYERDISDGDEEFEMVCRWLDAPVTAMEHEEMLS